MTAALRVVSSMLTTVQDFGRPAARRYGVPWSGAMDCFALQAANRLVGNDPGLAALEITVAAGFEVLRPVLLALAGADLAARIDGRLLEPWHAAYARAGSQLVLAGRRKPPGARAYLALAGGIDVPLVLGSRSTCLPGEFGGLAGRPLRPGDLLSLGECRQDISRLAGQHWPLEARPAYRQEPGLRVLPGPHADLFAADGLEALLAQSWRVSPDSNRMGYRLQGATIPYAQPCSLPSLGVVPGTIQVPPDGAPILLMADAQPTGGYPILAVVIGPDLPLAAQLLPGDNLRFELTTEIAALAARQTFQRWLNVALREDDATLLSAWAEMPG